MTVEIDFVVKLGGSAITNKDAFEILNVDALDAAADVLAECYRLDLRFIVAHGAGYIFNFLTFGVASSSTDMVSNSFVYFL